MFARERAAEAEEQNKEEGETLCRDSARFWPLGSSDLIYTLHNLTRHEQMPSE